MKFMLNSVAVVSGMFVGFIAYMYFFAKRKNVIYHSFAVQKNSQDCRELSIFFISDIHRRRIDERLLKKVRSLGLIDIVIIGGDLAEGGVPLSTIDQNVERLSQLAPLFFIWGNNDREVGE